MVNRKIGLALGSGAVRGYAIIPIIKRVEKEGIEISAISGSSVGALIGAYYALYGEIDSFLNQIKKMTKKDYLKLVDLNNPKISIIKGQKIKEYLSDNFFKKKTFEDLQLPLEICAVDLIKKKSVYIDQGQIIDAVMASISIPGIFPPYKIGKKTYIDGGVLEPVPAKRLLDKGLKKVVGINLTGFKSSKKRSGDESIIAALMNSFYMMMERMAKLENSKRLFMLDLRFEPDPAHMLAFYDWEDPYKIGKNVINNKIKELNKWLVS